MKAPTKSTPGCQPLSWNMPEKLWQTSTLPIWTSQVCSVHSNRMQDMSIQNIYIQKFLGSRPIKSDSFELWRSPALDFQVGQHVFINTEHIHITCPSKKLSDKNLRPYKIIAKVGSHSFTLQLPNSMRAIHPVFHVSMLEPATPDTIPNRTQPPQPSKLTENWSLRYLRFWTPRSTANASANYYT